MSLNKNKSENVMVVDLVREDEGVKKKVAPRSKLVEPTRRASLTEGVIARDDRKRKISELGLGMEGEAYKKEEDSCMFVMMEAIYELTRHSKELDKQVTENQNTKKEIKDLSSKIRRQMEVLNRQALREWRERHRFKKVEPIMLEADTQTGRNVAEVATQTVFLDESDGERALKVCLENGSSFGDLSQYLDIDWPNEVFECTALRYTSLGEMEVTGDMAIIIDPKRPVEKIPQSLRVNIPGLTDMVQAGLVRDQVEYICRSTSATNSRGVSVNKEDTFLLVPYEEGEKGFVDAEALHDTLERSRNVALRKGIKELTIISIGNNDGECLRKCAEFVFRKSGISINLVRPRQESNRQKGGTTNSRNRDPHTRLVISAEGKSFSEVLKKVKKEVNPEECGVQVSSIRKNAKGDVVLSIKGGMEKAEKLKNEINAKAGGVVVKPIQDGTTLFISGIDEATEKVDIVEAVAHRTGLSSTSIMVGAIREKKFGSRTTTVTLPRREAQQLLEERVVKIGWVSCKVQELIHLKRCYRCSEYGHAAAECKSGMEKNGCFNCGKEGHLARECKAGPFCTACQQEGHRSDNMRCPVFRKMVNQERDRREAKRHTARSDRRAGGTKVLPSPSPPPPPAPEREDNTKGKKSPILTKANKSTLRLDQAKPKEKVMAMETGEDPLATPSTEVGVLGFLF